MIDSSRTNDDAPVRRGWDAAQQLLSAPTVAVPRPLRLAPAAGCSTDTPDAGAWTARAPDEESRDWADLDRRLVSYVIQHGRVDDLRDLDSAWLVDDEARRVLSFLRDYRRQYGQPPPAQALTANFPTWQQQLGDNSLEYLLEQLRQRRRHEVTEALQASALARDQHGIDRWTQELAAVAAVALTASPTFQVCSDADLLLDEGPPQWLIQGLLMQPTYGMIAGEQKTFKSYTLLLMALAVASGEPFAHTMPVQQGPVVFFVGEGGRRPFKRRYQRLRKHLGLANRALPFTAVFGTAPVDSPEFQSQLRRALDDHRPVLVIIDPWYSYHGTRTNSSVLHEEGALLASVSSPCMAAGATLLIGNHFNKTGGGTGLARITQTGGAEWSDSWILTSHRLPPDLEASEYRLQLNVGSRQWGGRKFDLDFAMGGFNEEEGDFDGDIHVELRPSGHAAEDVQDPLQRKIKDALAEQPWVLTKTTLYNHVRGNRASVSSVLADLLRTGVVVTAKVPGLEGRTVKRRERLALAGAPLPVQPEP